MRELAQEASFPALMPYLVPVKDMCIQCMVNMVVEKNQSTLLITVLCRLKIKAQITARR